MQIKEVQERLIKIADVINENKSYLQDLDREIGDGDHGFNMNRGFSFVKEDMEGDFKDLKALFMKISMDLISKVGGASGPLYGTFFMKFAQNLEGKEDFNREDFNLAFKNGLQGVKQRGKAEISDKTMVDVLEPVSLGLEEGKSFEEIIKLAEEKKDYTKDLVAKKGRASYLGERSKGHIDPGAMSSYLIIKTGLENL
ncbi:MAG: dihydroxyacetone kinase subunit DhaL [Peptoniphilaceae bacterium]|nr:dihydroxyacetone kinase subunit DhaL [Peptoniphilaceae bacterium]MDY6018770.1 dihydroxyacetone kinase subunit DhaL [Anaerococcus sp.]